jgi:tRNA(fMet)-specific endonuclease VapC
VIPSGALVLLDTNVLVHLVRGKAVGQQIDTDYALSLRPDRPLISFVSMGEAKALGLKLGWSKPKLDRLDQLLRQLVIVNINAGDILDRYAEIDHYSEKVVRPARRMGKNDVWIGATAAATGAWLITTDNDFDHLTPRYIRRVKVDPHSGVTIP